MSVAKCKAVSIQFTQLVFHRPILSADEWVSLSMQGYVEFFSGRLGSQTSVLSSDGKHKGKGKAGRPILFLIRGTSLIRLARYLIKPSSRACESTTSLQLKQECMATQAHTRITRASTK